MTWTPTDPDLADAEGWNVFLAEGSIQNKDGDRPYQLQRVDERAVFDGDAAAWKHVYDQAHAGSALHQRALNHLRAESLPEFEAIIHECSPDGRELNKEFVWS